ncbi:helix-turn-helix domain-containing protein [Xanthobacter sediminis]
MAVQTVRSRDMDAHAGALSGWQQEYRALAGGGFSGSLTLAQAGEVTLFREETNLKLIQRTAQPLHMTALAAVTPGSAPALLKGKGVDAGDVLVFDATTETEFVCCDHMEVSAVALPREMLTRFGPLPHAMDRRDSRGVPHAAAAGAFRHWLQNLLLVLSGVAGAGGLPEIAEALPLLVAGNCYAMLEQVFGEADDVRRHLTPPQRYAVVAKARAYMDANVDSCLTVPEIACAVGISTRFLDQCFSEVLGLGPAAYLRAVRLDAARRDILGPSGTVAEIAMRHGFWHLGRFSAYYRAQFGESPSDTLRRRPPPRARR